VDNLGNLYIADSGNNRVRKVEHDRLFVPVKNVICLPFTRWQALSNLQGAFYRRSV